MKILYRYTDTLKLSRTRMWYRFVCNKIEDAPLLLRVTENEINSFERRLHVD